jgi:hypothetical protein
MMTVAQTRFDPHNAERPREGAHWLTVLEAPLGEAYELPIPGRTEVRTKSPEGAIGGLVPMTKRLTTGIETSPMQRWPIDRVALRVVQPGIHYTPNGLKTFLADFEGESPPPVNVPADTQDLTGLSVGQLVVVRYLGDNIERGRNKRYSRWLVRCLCGAYEHRKGASLRRVASSADSEADRCWECQNLKKLRGLKPSQPDNWQVNPISTVALLPGANEVFAGGERFGRLTVIGYGGSNRSRQGARWVVRCDCGLYGLMSAAGLKRGNSPQQCTICFQAQMGAKP